MAIKLSALFWIKVDKGGPLPDHAPHLGACWLWTAGTSRDGYGLFGVANSSSLAHRLSWADEHGHIAERLQVDHLCRVRACVRPTHLELVTSAENTRRGALGLAMKTHCPKGHEYSEANTLTGVDRFGYPGRRCRTCRRAQDGLRRRAAAVAVSR
jgi:hypothetical protein